MTYLLGVQEKMCFYAVRDLKSSQRNASVQSVPLAGNFFVQPIAAEGWRGRGDKFSRILGKNTIFNEPPERSSHYSSHTHHRSTSQVSFGFGFS